MDGPEILARNSRRPGRASTTSSIPATSPSTVRRRRPRRPPREEGFDSIGVVMVYCRNDGSDITVVRDAPAPTPSDDLHYDQMIRHPGHIYDSWFQHV